MQIKLILILILISTSNTFGQLKVVSEDQFAEFTNIFKESNSVPHITTTIAKSFNDKVLDRTKKDIYEFQSADKTKQTFYELVNSEFIEKSVYIRYEDTEYRREKGKEWRVNKLAKGGIPTPFAVMNTPRLDQFAVGDSTLERKPVRLFSRYQILYFNNKLSFSDSLYWVSSEGKIIKSISKYSSMFPDNIGNIYESTYDYIEKVEILPPADLK